jgi:hypothetical protein
LPNSPSPISTKRLVAAATKNQRSTMSIDPALTQALHPSESCAAMSTAVCIKRDTFEIKSLRCRGKTSGEQRHARLGELHVGAALVQPEPALGEGVVKRGLVFRRRALELIEEWPVEASRRDRQFLGSSASIYSATLESTFNVPSKPNMIVRPSMKAMMRLATIGDIRTPRYSQ